MAVYGGPLGFIKPSSATPAMSLARRPGPTTIRRRTSRRARVNREGRPTRAVAGFAAMLAETPPGRSAPGALEARPVPLAAPEPARRVPPLRRGATEADPPSLAEGLLRPYCRPRTARPLPL